MNTSEDDDIRNARPAPGEGVNESDDPPSWVELRDHVERELAKFSIGSVALLVIDDLWIERSGEEQLKTLPWLALLLVKWSLQVGTTLRIGPRLPKPKLLQLKHALWDGNDRAFLERSARHKAEFGPDRPQSIGLMLRTQLATQLQFQKRQIWGLYRTAGLIRRLEPNHKSKRIFREQIGLEVDDFVDGCILLYSLSAIGETRELNAIDLEHFGPMRAGMLKKVLKLMSRNLPDLRLELLREPRMKGNSSRELALFPIFKRYPFLQTRRGQYWCWHRSVLDRYMDERAHLELSKAGQKYADSFSGVFETYVVDQSRRLGFPIMTARQYLDAYGTGETIKNVEAVVTNGNRRLLIEAKMGLFPDEVLFQETEKGARSKLVRVLEAVEQAQTVSHRLASVHSDNEEHYLIVVTSRDLIIGTGLFLEDMCGPGSLTPPPGAEQNHLPINRVFVLSIDEFEGLVEFVATGKVALFELLERASASARNLAGCSFQFSAFYPNALGGIGRPSPMPEFIEAEHRAAMQRLFVDLDVHQSKQVRACGST